MFAEGRHRPVVSVVIPAFNEQESIEDVLTRTCKVVESGLLPYEIIVVDDGSADETRELASKHKAVVLWNGINLGKGAALRKGIMHAQGEIVVTMDADGSHHPEDIPKLIGPILNGATLTTGTRFSTSEGRKSTKKINRVGNGIINFSILLLTGKRITDSQCGFRAIRRSFLKDVNIVSDGFEVETELLMKALRNGNIIREVPLDVVKRKNGHSHISRFRDGMKIMKTITKLSFAY